MQMAPTNPMVSGEAGNETSTEAEALSLSGATAICIVRDCALAVVQSAVASAIASTAGSPSSGRTATSTGFWDRKMTGSKARARKSIRASVTQNGRSEAASAAIAAQLTQHVFVYVSTLLGTAVENRVKLFTRQPRKASVQVWGAESPTPAEPERAEPSTAGQQPKPDFWRRKASARRSRRPSAAPEDADGLVLNPINPLAIGVGA
jgi:hypothetical protein